jgi:hypothetical protein
MTNELDLIRACKYLYLNELTEPSDNELRIVFAEAMTGELADPQTMADDPVLQKMLSGARAIVQTTESKVFELSWPTYVAYSVRNESFVSSDKYEEFEGRLLVKYSKSRYLDFVAAATFASSDHPGPLQHWGLCCLNHIVDVVAVGAPSIALRSNRPA